MNFLFVGLASWRSFLDWNHPEYISYGFNILRHARQIQEWGQREIYSFLSLTELESLMRKTGFREIKVENTLAGQVYVISSVKPSGLSERVHLEDFPSSHQTKVAKHGPPFHDLVFANLLKKSAYFFMSVMTK